MLHMAPDFALCCIEYRRLMWQDRVSTLKKDKAAADARLRSCSAD